MKKALIAYFSQGGTTAKIAKEISKGLSEKDYEVDLYSITEESPPDVMNYDLIGVGSPVYIFRPPFNVMGFVKKLPGLNGLPFFVFMLHGTHPGTAGNVIRKSLERKGGREIGYSCFRGADFFVGYIQRGILFSPDNPSQNELEICPFCRQSHLRDSPGRTECPSCQTVFEIDDRVECVFVDTESLKMPILGQVCTVCGLIQQDQRDSCVYCGTGFSKTYH